MALSPLLRNSSTQSRCSAGIHPPRPNLLGHHWPSLAIPTAIPRPKTSILITGDRLRGTVQLQSNGRHHCFGRFSSPRTKLWFEKSRSIPRFKPNQNKEGLKNQTETICFDLLLTGIIFSSEILVQPPSRKIPPVPAWPLCGFQPGPI